MKKSILLLLVIMITTSFKQQKQITWVAIGDSITYLNDHPDETGNRVQKGYLTRVVEKLPHLHYINQGHNGWRAADIAEKIDSLGLVKADVYSIFLGTNDWWSGRLVGTLVDYQNAKGNISVYGSFRIIVDKIRKLNPDAKIILITPMQRHDFVYVADKNNNAYGSYKPKNGQTLEQVANAVNKIGQLEKIPVIDLYHDNSLKMKDLVNFKRVKNPVNGKYQDYKFPASNNTTFNPATDDYPYPVEATNLTYDGLHPSDKGNAVIAKRIVSTIKGLNLN
jgi:lysophospholipase L1-like esterase